ncbi:hypothetical protein [Sphingomonas parapaucimobilis]|uniref:hypothetical protein n=1 Tax=Sphingomonas parapaucimobilis TaxID=28213 RepID=UPI0035C8550B
MLWKMLRERSRSRAVRHLGVLGTPAEPGLDRFVAQAASAFAAPISLLTVLHDQQMLVKASTGLDMECLPRKDVNRRPKRTPYRRPKGTPFVEQRDGYDGCTVRAGCGVGRA